LPPWPLRWWQVQGGVVQHFQSSLDWFYRYSPLHLLHHVYSPGSAHHRLRDWVRQQILGYGTAIERVEGSVRAKLTSGRYRQRRLP
jgi:hypothetical protein